MGIFHLKIVSETIQGGSSSVYRVDATSEFALPLSMELSAFGEDCLVYDGPMSD